MVHTAGDRGPHCWIDPVGKRHYRLRTEHLRVLVSFKEQGNALNSHNDVPQHVRDQLHLEERQRLERQPKSNNVSSPFPPINITNVLAQSHQSPMSISTEPTPAADVRPCGNICFTVPGLRDKAVREYSEWQQSNVGDERLKAEFRKAYKVALRFGLDLEQVYSDQDPGLFVKEDVVYGVARRLFMTLRDVSSDTSLLVTLSITKT